MSLIIAGSRTVDPSANDIDRELVRWFGLLEIPGAIADVVAEVVCGGAQGGDDAGERWATINRIRVHREPVTKADYAEYGSYLAPKMRNRRMANRGSHAIAFWDGTSGGTADMVTRMVARAKPVLVVPMRATRVKPSRPRTERSRSSTKSNPETTPDRRRPD